MAGDPDFKPDLTPEQMHMLGVLGPQYYGEDAKEHNFFGIDASQNDWPSEWKDGKAPLGWFQWYAGYANGKRTPDDQRQIGRWKSFKARHMGPLEKADPSLKDFGVHTRRRQALLHWGIAPGFTPSDYVSTSGVKVTDETLKNPPIPDTPMKKKTREEQEKTAGQVPLRQAMDIAQGYSGVRLMRNLSKARDLRREATKNENISRKASNKVREVTGFFPGPVAKKQQGLREISYRRGAQASRQRREADSLKGQIEDDALRTATTGAGVGAIGLGSAVKYKSNKEKKASMHTNPYLEKLASYNSEVIRARYDHDRPYTGEVSLSSEEKEYFNTDRKVRKDNLDRKAKKVIPAVMGATGTLGALAGAASKYPKRGGLVGAGIGLALGGAGSYLGYQGSDYSNQNAAEHDAVRRNPVLNKLMQNQEFSHAISEPERLAWEDVDLDEMSPTQEEAINTLYDNWAKDRDFRPPSVVTEYDREGNPNRLSVTIDERNRYKPFLSNQ